jgi:hypothetical protein
MTGVRFPAGTKELFLLQSVQIVSAIQLTGGSSFGDKAAISPPYSSEMELYLHFPIHIQYIVFNEA